MAETFYSWDGKTLILTCHAQPGAKKDEIAGLHGDALKIRITAPPVDGKANKHLCAFLAKTFGVRKSDVKLLSGETNRHKRIAVQNLNCVPELLKDYTT